MAKPVCRVLIPGTLEQAFLIVLDLLGRSGLTLTNPGSTKITTWTDCGDPVDVAVAKALSEVLSGSISNVQFWRGASEDVFVAWENTQGRCIFSIYLDGLDSAFAAELTAKFAESVLTKFRSEYDDGQALAIEFE
jgi:hypothetical protein